MPSQKGHSRLWTSAPKPCLWGPPSAYLLLLRVGYAIASPATLAIALVRPAKPGPLTLLRRISLAPTIGLRFLCFQECVVGMGGRLQATRDCVPGSILRDSKPYTSCSCTALIAAGVFPRTASMTQHAPAMRRNAKGRRQQSRSTASLLPPSARIPWPAAAAHGLDPAWTQLPCTEGPCVVLCLEHTHGCCVKSHPHWVWPVPLRCLWSKPLKNATQEARPVSHAGTIDAGQLLAINILAGENPRISRLPAS